MNAFTAIAALPGAGAAAAFGVRKTDTRLRDELNAYLAATRQSRHHLMFRYLDESALSLIALARRE